MEKIELLAPAGGAAAALAAFDAGADAIYAGLPKYSARERSENFTPEVMARMVEYAHRLGRRVYVTVNTVVKENELPEVAEYLAMLEEIAPDAVIVQDIGVMRMIREFFPKLTIHASTQVGFANSPGLAMAEKLGAKRVILERQMTFDEIRALRASSSLELEMFIHGALCCSLSGQCLFSSWLGGASGNRGRCKQACRRRFFSNRGNGFFFSPQDLCLIDRIDEIRSLGVTSLKIEGRLRQPDYVKNVVSAYRMVLDAPAGRTDAKLLGEARNLLARSCGRKWSHGFYTPESTRQLISFGSLGAAGMLCGTVDEVRDNGFSFTTGKKLHLGDRVRVQPPSGDEGAALTVTRMFVNNQSEKKARPGDRVFICWDKPAPFRGLVFKIGESCDDYSARIAALPKPRRQLALRIDVSAARIGVAVNNAPLADWSQTWSLTPAEKRALDAETLAEAFRAADSDDFAAGSIDCRIDGNWFCPAAVLKAARRTFWNYCKENLRPEAVFSDSAAGLERFRKALQGIVPATAAPDATETVAVRPGGEMPGSRRAVRAASVFESVKFATEAVLPEFCAESGLASLKRAIRNAYDRGIRKFRSPALYGLTLLEPYRDIEVTCGGVLPVCNSMAVLELASFGVAKVLAHVELERDAVLALAAHAALPVELYRFGRPVLLITRAPIPTEGDFRDGRGNEFTVKYDRNDRLTRVYPRRIVSVPRLPGLLDYYDVTNANWNAHDTVTFNFETGLQ